MRSSKLNQRRQQATPCDIGVMCSYFVEKAESATLWDIGGSETIDFAAGIAVLNTGYYHPKAVTAVADQLQAFTHTTYRVIPYESYVSLAERINDLASTNGLARTVFFTTGAEVVESTVEIAYVYADRPGLVTFGGGFHGRTSMTTALTGKVAPYKVGFEPFPGSVYHGAYPNEAHDMTATDVLKNLEHIFKADIVPDQVAATILEPIQGEDGFSVTPTGFVQVLHDLCDARGTLLIADRVRTGFARTGKLFVMQRYKVKPDLMTAAKSLAGGFPLSGVVGRAGVIDALAPDGLSGTYADNPLAVAVAYTVLDTIAEEQLCQWAEQLGNHPQEMLNQTRTTCPAIVNIRDRGLMVAVGLNDPQTSEPSPEFTCQVQQKVQENGPSLLSCDVYGNVVRFPYPLVIPDAWSPKAPDILACTLKS